MKGWNFKGHFENGRAEEYGVLLMGSDFGLGERFFENISSSLSLEKEVRGSAKTIGRGSLENFDRVNSMTKTPASGRLPRKSFSFESASKGQ